MRSIWECTLRLDIARTIFRGRRCEPFFFRRTSFPVLFAPRQTSATKGGQGKRVEESRREFEMGRKHAPSYFVAANDVSLAVKLEKDERFRRH